MTDQPERLSTDALPPGCPAWAGALFGELALESDLTSYRVVEAQVDGQGRVAGSGPSGPGPGQQLAAHAVELTDMPPPEAAQEGPQGGWRLDHAA